MKVFAVLISFDENAYLDSIFSTEESATTYMDELNSGRLRDGVAYIEEYELQN